MTKKLNLSVLSIMIIFLLFSCNRENQINSLKYDSNKSESAMQQNIVAGRSSNSNYCSGPYDGMSLNLVRDMILNYKTNQLSGIRNSTGIRDSRACWFDLERLKDYICRLETEVVERGCIDPNNLGLRFYYAAHSRTQPLNGVPSNYRGLHTLIIVPTYADVQGNNVDFDPTKFDPENCKPLPLNKIKGSEILNNALTMNILPGNIFAIDHGQLGPPDSLAMHF